MEEKHISHMVLFYAFEWILGITCFGIFRKHNYISCQIRHPLDNVLKDPEQLPTEDPITKCRMVFEIATVTIDSFPLVILPLFIVAHIKYGRQLDYNIINPLCGVVGFLVNVVAGGIQLRVLNQMRTSRSLWVMILDFTPYTALSVLCILNSLLFLSGVIFWLAYKRNGQVSPLLPHAGLVSTYTVSVPTNPGLLQMNPVLLQTNPGLQQTNPGLLQMNPGLQQTNPTSLQSYPMSLNQGLNSNPIIQQTF